MLQVNRGTPEGIMADVDYALATLGVEFLDVVVLCRVPSPALIPLEQWWVCTVIAAIAVTVAVAVAGLSCGDDERPQFTCCFTVLFTPTRSITHSPTHLQDGGVGCSCCLWQGEKYWAIRRY